MDLSQFDMKSLTLMGAGGCAVLSLHLSLSLISQHLFYWKNPKEQKAIIIILLMAPLYAVNSFFGLVKIDGNEVYFTFLEAIKECYEALVIAKFLSLMYSYVGISMSKNVIPDDIKGRTLHFSFPITLFMPHEAPLNQKNLQMLKWWTWQFVVLRPFLSVLMIILQLFGIYEGPITWIVSLILNASVTLAMYSLINFYHAFGKELAPHNPLAKFICIKGVVFFSFWQGMVLQMLAYVGIVHSVHQWLNIEQVEEAYQNLLICAEMVAFSFLQKYAFSVSEYSKETEAKMKREKKND